MNKSTNSKTKYCIQWESHSKHIFKGLCSLMEHQSLVDIAICCGNNTLHAHKCVLAANSPLFREELEKNSTAEQVIINGCDFTVMKSIIEIMYCGETIIGEEYIKYLVAAAKLFQMRSLENLFIDRNEYNPTGDEIFLPRPQFLSKKPKYPTAYHPFNNAAAIPGATTIIKPMNYSINDPYNQRRFKRKYIRAEAEKACAKEAQASRMALANLQKEIASTPQVNSFIIEESCTETTVENFIPHNDESFVDKLNELQQLQVVNYADLDNYTATNQYVSDTKPPNMIQFALQSNNPITPGLTADKIKHILGTDIPSNVEIMFKTSEGNFVSVTDEVLQNLSKGGLQYQVVDENGHVGEVQELQVLEREAVQKVEKINSAIDVTEEDGNKFTAEESKLPKLLSDDYMASSFLNTSESVMDTSVTQTTVTSCSYEKDFTNGLNFTTSTDFQNANFAVHNGEIFERNDGNNDSEEPKNKPIEFVPLNNSDFLEISTSSLPTTNPIDTIGSTSFYSLSHDGVLSNPSLGNYTTEVTTVIESGGNLTTSSPKKSKFSPDMFFADLPTIDTSSPGISDDTKNTVLNRRKT